MVDFVGGRGCRGGGARKGKWGEKEPRQRNVLEVFLGGRKLR